MKIKIMNKDNNFFDAKNYTYSSFEEYQDYWNSISPITTIKEVMYLNKMLLTKKNFLITVGDCAELFNETSRKRIERFIGLLDELKNNLQKKESIRKVILSMRAAGQYGKSRSKAYENNYYTYFGDAINHIGKSKKLRTPNIFRLYEAFLHSRGVANFIRKSTCDEIIYRTHEALLLQYEYLFCRKYSRKLYYLGAHLPWIGIRTRDSQINHLTFLKKITNPVAVKIDATVSLNRIKEIIFSLYSKFRPTLLILRIGRKGIGEYLNEVLGLKQLLEEKNVVLICDPMHGNTHKRDGRKIRRFSDINEETQIFFQTIWNSEIKITTGIHLETSALSIQECENNSQATEETVCDPRLTYSETVSLVKSIGKN